MRSKNRGLSAPHNTVQIFFDLPIGFFLLHFLPLETALYLCRAMPCSMQICMCF
jgi:hypothetical protein